MKVQRKFTEQVFAFWATVLSLIYIEINQLSAQVAPPGKAETQKQVKKCWKKQAVTPNKYKPNKYQYRIIALEDSINAVVKIWKDKTALLIKENNEKKRMLDSLRQINLQQYRGLQHFFSFYANYLTRQLSNHENKFYFLSLNKTNSNTLQLQKTEDFLALDSLHSANALFGPFWNLQRCIAFKESLQNSVNSELQVITCLLDLSVSGVGNTNSFTYPTSSSNKGSGGFNDGEHLSTYFLQLDSVLFNFYIIQLLENKPGNYNLQKELLAFLEQKIDLHRKKKPYSASLSRVKEKEVEEYKQKDKKNEVGKKDNFLQQLPHNTGLGYRVQIHIGDNRSAQQAKLKFLTLYPETLVYKIYSKPLYKVRVGNFLLRAEAEAFCNSIKKNFPSAMVVPDADKH